MKLGSNVGPTRPKHHGKPASIGYQKTKPANNIRKPRKSAKPPPPGSNPGGASTFLKKNCTLVRPWSNLPDASSSSWTQDAKCRGHNVLMLISLRDRQWR